MRLNQSYYQPALSFEQINPSESHPLPRFYHDTLVQNPVEDIN